jgi:DNA-binding CsgD family transcriptional regulator
MFLGCAQRAYGLALRAAGNLPQAELALREALDNDTALGARPYAVLDAVALGRLLLERGDPTAAMPIIQKAAADARLLDLPGPLATAQHLLIRLAAKIRERDPLTPREREVALLVLAAMSNRRIAEQLVLSERTVETHVRSILGKLGHGNRTEFVAHWHP